MFTDLGGFFWTMVNSPEFLRSVLAFLGRDAGAMRRVVDVILPLVHLDLGRSADADHGRLSGVVVRMCVGGFSCAAQLNG
jgi:hypothetical protein